MQNHIKGQLKIRSALDHYEGFSGWESRDLQSTENKLKQFRNNLNHYEDKFKEKQQLECKKRKVIRSRQKKSDKENEIKLPIIFAKEGMSRKGSFLELRNRNILKEAIENVHNQKKQILIIHEMVQRQKKGDSRQHKEVRQMKLIKALKQTCELKELTHLKNFLKECKEMPRGQTCCLKERKDNAYYSHPSQSIHLNREYDIIKGDDEFNDAKMILRQYRKADEKNGDKLVFKSQTQEEN